MAEELQLRQLYQPGRTEDRPWHVLCCCSSVNTAWFAQLAHIMTCSHQLFPKPQQRKVNQHRWEEGLQPHHRRSGVGYCTDAQERAWTCGGLLGYRFLVLSNRFTVLSC
eukprot:5612477-Amphidinium_carterae.1